MAQIHIENEYVSVKENKKEIARFYGVHAGTNAVIFVSAYNKSMKGLKPVKTETS